jgi:uncharacterized protein YndB with AHSA1/START domain
MSKKTSKKTAKKSVSQKKTAKSKSSKPVAKKAKVVKKTAPKKVKAVKKAAPKKKVVAKKKAVKPTPKKIKAKKAVPTKKVAKPVVKAKAVVVKKQAPTKPIKAAKTSKIAVKKAEPGKNLKPIFQPAKKTNNMKFQDEIPDPPGKYELEYTIHTSTPILFDFLTTPPGLSEWFCDDVDIRNGIYSFKWDEVPQNARLVKMIEESVVRYQWLDKKDNTYFEFRIERDDLTNDISLIVADFADTLEDKTSSTLLWNSQIEKLLHVLGSF